jgi:cell shape-determining protein MreC
MEAPSSSKSKSRKSDKDKKVKKSGVRTKFLIESLRNDYYSLREENDRLRSLVSVNLPEEAADAILAKAKATSIDELAGKMTGTSVSGDDMDDDDDDEDF